MDVGHYVQITQSVVAGCNTDRLFFLFFSPVTVVVWLVWILILSFKKTISFLVVSLFDSCYIIKDTRKGRKCGRGEDAAGKRTDKLSIL